MEEGSVHFLGNDAVVRRLEAKLEADRMPHAVIFSGPAGIGKQTLATHVIRALNCREPGTWACGECGPCGKIARGTHPDVTTVSVEGTSTQIRIEQIRALRTTLELQPVEGRARASILDPAERMTPGAANALLKALEEPPPGSYFFLITRNANDLLPTIRSRCQTYHFAPLSLEEIRELGTTDELVARWAQGSPGRAIDCDPDLLRKDRDEMLGFLEAGLGPDPAALADRVGARLGARDTLAELIRIGGGLVSDLLFLKLGMRERVVNVDIEDRLQTLAASLEMERLIRAAEELQSIEENLRFHVNAQMMTDAMLTRLAFPNSR